MKRDDESVRRVFEKNILALKKQLEVCQKIRREIDHRKANDLELKKTLKLEKQLSVELYKYHTLMREYETGPKPQAKARKRSV